jgi:hypothetical protein
MRVVAKFAGWTNGSDIIGVSRLGIEWTVDRAKKVIDSDRERCNGDLSKLDKNIQAVRCNKELSDFCPQSDIDLALDILDIYEETRRRRNNRGQIAGIDIRGIIRRLHTLYAPA